MKSTSNIFRLLMATVLLTVAPHPAFASGADIANIIFDIIAAYKAIWISIAILVTIIVGLTLMVSHDEASLTKARSALTAILIGGIVTVLLINLRVDSTSGILSWIYNGSLWGNGLIGSPTAFGDEAQGIAAWISTVAAVAGLLSIIIAATRAVFSFGDEAEYAKVRASILHVIIGLLVIGAAYVFQTVFFDTGKPDALLAYFLTPLRALLAIIGLIVVGIIIYAGLRMIISLGKEDEFTAARSLIVRALIGLVIIIISVTLISVVQSCFSGPCLF